MDNGFIEKVELIPMNDKGEPNGIDKTSWELQERHKELACVYKVSEILEDENESPDSALQKVVEAIPPAWQYPEITRARIILEGHEFRSQDFKTGPWHLKSDLKVKGEKMGTLEVYYIESRPEEDEGPFLKDERKLINLLSERISRFLEQRRLDEELMRYRSQLKKLMRSSIIEEDIESTAEEEGLEWEIMLGLLAKTDPPALLRITRKMLYHLARYYDESFENLMGGLCPLKGEEREWCGINIPNPRSSMEELQRVQKGVFAVAKDKMSSREIMDIISLWIRQNKARPLLLASENRRVSLSEITDTLQNYFEIPEEERSLSREDDISIRTNLIRRFLTEQLEYLNVAKDHIGIEDFSKTCDFIVGPGQGVGTLGGKTSGIILAERIIRGEMERDEDFKGIKFARSWYLSSDTMRDFIHYNALNEVAHIKYMDPQDIRKEQPFLEQVFKNGAFTSEIIAGLREVLRDLEGKPIIVRSSSHLEDSFGAAFSGKYKSLFITNQGSEEKRLAELMDAIAEVWASTFGPNAIEYRNERGMLDLMEEMGILIQEVVGTGIGPYYLPAFAGVAFSSNEFRWSPRIRREDGILRLVAGLGTRAVDRVADDYPMLISPNRPELRVNTMVDEAIQYSQRYMDVINMEEGFLETVEVQDMFSRYGGEYPMLNRIVSIHRQGDLVKPRGLILNPKNEEMIVTFDGVIERPPFIKQIKKVMKLLEKTLKTPVDIEFAHNGECLYILQCRPQSRAAEAERVPLPTNIPRYRKLFEAKRYVTTGHLRNINYIVCVDPAGYENLESRENMMKVAEIISELNNELPKRRFILMGPGRWGSRGDIKLGVPVQYRDINNTCLLIEIAKRKGGYLPDLSFGTHFFQDLVEADIHYLPLYPDEGDSFLNEELIELAENRLLDVVKCPDRYASVVKLIKVADLSEGGALEVIMDGEANEALAYLAQPDHSEWRMMKVKEIARALDPKLYGVKKLYLIGSVKDYTAGPASDIDLLVHFDGPREKKEDLLAWFREWSRTLDRENKERTGYETGGLLDVHIITDEDIEGRDSWAVHIDSKYGSAKEIPVGGNHQA